MFVLFVFFYFWPCITLPADIKCFFVQYLKSELTTFGEKYYPDGCPFSIKFEVYQNYENRKVEESVSKWTCNFCGKSFVSEDFLDQHFERKHPGHLRNVNIP